ncbi:MAG: flippase-like domain-containing protein [Ignavibacteria bacterium]|nr:flippase-like domain-containing protein [Ignavibacteria bacterium]
MKNKKTEIAFFVFGLAVFLYLVVRFGIDQITANIAGAGWSLLGAVLVWFIIYVVNTLAWKLLLGEESKQVTFIHLFMVTVSGFSIDTITPVIALGGEPYKVKALATTVGTRQALSAVLVYRMVHVLGHMLILFVGTLSALAFLTLPVSLVWMLIVTGAVMLVIVILIISGLRDGVFHRVQSLIEKTALLRRFTHVLKKHEHSFNEMDEVVTHAYRNRRGKFYGAVLLEFVSRACMGVEVYLILRGTGVEISLISALFVYVAYSIIINAVFFIPLNLGVREGGLYLGLQSLALPPMLGIYLGVVIRIREFIWILLGLLLILPLTRRSEKAIPYPEERTTGTLP